MTIKRELIRNHEAVGAFSLVVDEIPIEAWAARASPDRWTPAQQVNHIVLSYRAMVHDVRDGRHAQFIGTARQRRIWRLFGLSQVMFLDRIPPGARAPREIRPPDYSPDRKTLQRELRSALDDFERTMRSADSERPRHRVAHPYFGWLSLRQAVRVCTVHTHHHRELLRRSLEPAA